MGDDQQVAELRARLDENNQKAALELKQTKDGSAAEIAQLKGTMAKEIDDLTKSEAARFNEMKSTAAAEFSKLKDDMTSTIARMNMESEAAGVLGEDKLKQVKADCDGKIKDMEKSVASAQSSEGDTQNAMKELGSLIASAASTAPALLRAAKESLDDKQLKIDELEAQLAEMKTQFDVYKKYYDGVDQTSSDLEAEQAKTDKLTDEKTELEKTINSLEGQVAALTSDVAKAVESRNLAEGEKTETVARLDNTVEQNNQENSQLTATITDLEDTISKLNQEISDLKDSADSSNTEFMDNVQAARNALSEKLATEIARANAAEAEITKVNTQMEELKARLMKEIAESEAKIKQAAEKRKMLEDGLSGERRGLADSQAEADKVLTKFETQKIMIDQQQVDIVGLNAANAKANDELKKTKTKLTADINVLELEVETQKKSVERNQIDLAASVKDVEATRTALNSEKDANSKMKIDYEKVIAERDALGTETKKSTEAMEEQIANVTKNFADERETLSKRQTEKVAQLEASMAAAEAEGQKQMSELSESRKKQDEKNNALQLELTVQARKYKEVSEKIVSTKSDLAKALQTLAKNSDQFKQLASDLEAAGKLNIGLKASIATAEAEGQSNLEDAATQRAALSATIAELEGKVADEQAKVAEVRQSILERSADAETEAQGQTEARAKIEEQEQIISQMTDASEAAEKLRDEIREQHRADLEASQVEKEKLEKIVEQMTMDMNELNMKLDDCRRELLEAKQNYTEETVKREAREADIENGKKREEALEDRVRQKEDAEQKTHENTTDTGSKNAKELAESQAKCSDLQEKLAEAASQVEEAQLETSSWKAKTEEAGSKAAEGWAKAASDSQRADDVEQSLQQSERLLEETQAEWQADISAKEAEKIELLETNGVLMQELSDTKSQMEDEAAKRVEAENAREAAEGASKEAEAMVADTAASREELEATFTEQSIKLANVSAEFSKTGQLDKEELTSLQTEVERLRDDNASLTETNEEVLAGKTQAETAQGDAETAQGQAESAKDEAERHRDECLAQMEEAQADLSSSTAQNDEDMKAKQAECDALQSELDATTTGKGGLQQDFDKLKADNETLQDKHAELQEAKDEADADKRELADWKAEALVEQEAEHQHLEDTKTKLAGDITMIKSDQAQSQAQLTVAEKKLAEALASKASADQASTTASDARSKAAESLAIANSEIKTKTSKIEQMQDELRTAKEASEKATAAREEAKSSAASLNDEVGLLRSQLTTASKKESIATTEKLQFEAKLQKMETLSINQTKVLNDLRRKFTGCNTARKDQKVAMNKLLDIVRRAEAEAKSADQAVKSGAKTPVMQVLRQQASELDKCVQDAKANFDPKAGQFEPGEVKASAAKHVSGQASMTPDFDDDDESLSPEMLAMLEGGGSKAIMGSGGGSMGGGGGGGGGFETMKGTLEKQGSGKKDKAKKRHFVLGKNKLTYAGSAKADAKILGEIPLGGSTCKQTGDKIIVNSQGTEYVMVAKSATEAQKWADAISTNAKLSGDDDE